MGQKSRPKETPGLPTKPQIITGPRINSKQILCRISDPKIPEGGNDITEKKNIRNTFVCTLFVDLCSKGINTNRKIVFSTPNLLLDKFSYPPKFPESL